ncbi:MAG: hypothetical protein HY675_01645 [Chloroflexi bacterium]|nr:hypothetical protein [Chloroflexota bacterium]
MAPIFYVECPHCGHVYNVHKMVWDQGEEFLMYCPMCMARFPRSEGRIVSTNFRTQ